MFERKKLDWGEGETSFIEIFGNADKPGFQFAHATGFNALTYKELLEPLSDNFNVRAVDARGHGFTKLKADPQDMYDWKIYCDDLIKSVELFVKKTQKPIILSGHSMGAASAIQVAAIRPDLVSGLVLVDPVLMTSKIKVIFKIGRKYPIFKDFPIIKQGMMMSETTKKRRRDWKNKEEIFNSYKNKLIFKTWTETTIRNYIEGGTEVVGDETRLTCDPLWEAATFSSWKHDAMGLIDKLNCPITLLQAEFNSTARGNGPIKLMQKDKIGVHKIVKGSTHFLPMEFPDIIKEEINNLQKRINNEKK
ncbi:MAG: alpha/beta fold hydrolase [Alphaproteobacteria bacterium]